MLGFPTANLYIEESYKLIPSDGIYVVSLEFMDQQNLKTEPATGMAYIGHRPTINAMSRNIEVNIFDFDKDIYGQIIRINFLEYLRGDQKFDSLEELKNQLEKDEIAARTFLSRIPDRV